MPAPSSAVARSGVLEQVRLGRRRLGGLGLDRQARLQLARARRRARWSKHVVTSTAGRLPSGPPAAGVAWSKPHHDPCGSAGLTVWRDAAPARRPRPAALQLSGLTTARDLARLGTVVWSLPTSLWSKVCGALVEPLERVCSVRVSASNRSAYGVMSSRSRWLQREIGPLMLHFHGPLLQFTVLLT